MAAGDRDAVLQPHEFGQKFAAGNYRDTAAGWLPALRDWSASMAEVTTSAFAPLMFSAA